MLLYFRLSNINLCQEKNCNSYYLDIFYLVLDSDTKSIFNSMINPQSNFKNPVILNLVIKDRLFILPFASCLLPLAYAYK